MAFRLYIVPKVGDGSHPDPWRPKYFNSDNDGVGEVGIVTGQWSGVDYGLESWMIVGADLSVSDDNLVVGKSDAFAIPFDLATQLTSQQVTSVQNKLEAINVPAGWVNTSLQWVQVVRIVLGMFSFMQRFTVTNGNVTLFTSGVTLATRMNQLTQTVRDNLTATATSLELSSTNVTATTTIRQMLKILADQMDERQYNFNGTLI